MTNELAEILDRAYEIIPDAKTGLPQEAFYFVSKLTPMVNVELLIKNKDGQSILSWRADDFYGPAWHMPGGIIRFKESIEDRIMRVAQSELGCRVLFLPEPLMVRPLVNKQRDVRGHFISLLYLCKLESEPDSKLKADPVTPENGHWMWHEKAPQNLLSQHESFRRFIDDTPAF